MCLFFFFNLKCVYIKIYKNHFVHKLKLYNRINDLYTYGKNLDS